MMILKEIILLPPLLSNSYITNIASYHQDDASDSLRLDPVFTFILNKESLASQPTVSRAINRFDHSSINKFKDVLKFLFEKGNNPKNTKHIVYLTIYIVLDIDSTNIENLINFYI